MRIAVDATYSIGAQPSGVGVYSRELIAALSNAHPEERFLLAYRPHKFLRALGQAVPANSRRCPLFENFSIPGAGLFHGLNQRLPAGRYRSRVCTFHDLFVLTGEYSTVEFRRRFADQARKAAERADLIIAVSEFTACQVADHLGFDRSRIRVIPHGVHLPREIPTAPREKIVLHVGAIQRRKNVSRLLRAFELSPEGWTLILAGAAGYGAAEIMDQIRNTRRRADIRVLGYLSPPALEDLYARARILAFPSLDEGFGIPVLEAMAWGVPVLTSNCSALPEVAGNAAILVNPLDVEEIAAGLKSLMENSALAEEMASRGRERAAHFTWRRTAEKTWKVYEELKG